MSQIMRREPVGSLLDVVFSDFFNLPLSQRTAGIPATVRARMDVVDKGDKYSVAVDLPGVRKEDIQVSIDGPRVAISAENKSEQEVKNGARVLRTERLSTSYARNFELPDEVTEEGADAAFENGVLHLTLPKRAQAVSKRLTVR